MIADRINRGLERRWGLGSAPPEKFWGSWDGNPSFSGESVNATTALEVGAFFACVRLVTMTAGMTPLMVYRGEGRNRERARDSLQWTMLHDYPNAETAADSFWQLIVGDMIIGDGRWGDAFLEKARLTSGPRKGMVAELYRLSPWKVAVGRDTAGRKTYKLEGDPRVYYNDTVLHIPGFATGCLRGESIVHLARQDLGTAVSRERYEGSYYQNGATLDGYLKTNSTMSDAALDRIKTAWRNAYGGHKHGTPVLEADLDYKPISTTMHDQQFQEMSRQTANKVARWFGIDPEMIGGDRSSDTYATVEGRALHFLTFALDPWLVRLEKGLARDPDLFNSGLFPEFLRSAMLRVDAKTRWEIYTAGHAIGAYSPNDILVKENEPLRDGGDTYLDTPPGTAPANGTRHLTERELALLTGN